MSIQELETAVTRLSKEELAAFWKWFEQYMADEWDQQIDCVCLSQLSAGEDSDWR